MELWELIARERIRDTLARYNWAGDGARLAEVAATFCKDGVLEVRDRQTMVGRGEIVEFLGGVASGATPDPGLKRVVRHNVANLRFVEVTPELAKVESYFTVLTEIGLDHFGRYRDELVPVGDEWLIRHRFVKTDWYAANSTMAAP
jgi:hypothetical protein